MNINAKNLILGRVASLAAKKALLGENVNIFNIDLAVVTDGKTTVEKYKHKLERGVDPSHGPFFPKTPIGIIKRTIRGMLPYKQERGIEALARIKCYMGIPVKFKDVKLETIEKANLSKLPKYDFTSLKDLSNQLGWKR